MPLFIFKRTQSLHLNSKDNKKWSFIHYIHIFYYLITYLDHLCIFSFLIIYMKPVIMGYSSLQYSLRDKALHVFPKFNEGNFHIFEVHYILMLRI